MTAERSPVLLELELKLAAAQAKQGRPAQPSGPRRRRTPNPDAPPAPPDAAERAAHDYDADDVAPPTPPAQPTVPEHLRAHLVTPKATVGRLERANLAAVGDAPAYLGCDWAGLARMAASRAAAGIELDDLDVEALKRAEVPPIT